jgi:hypothetical protein
VVTVVSSSNLNGLQLNGEFVTDICRKCPAGYDQRGAGESSCEICISGRFSNTTGAEECEECPAGRFLNDNKLDKLEHDDATDCEICDLNTFAAVAGSYQCKNCPTGKYTDQSDNNGIMDSEDKCKPGADYEYKCPELYQRIDKSVYDQQIDRSIDVPPCIDCPRGYYGSFGSTSRCILCPTGFYSDNVKMGKCKECKDGEEDLLCNKGPGAVGITEMSASLETELFAPSKNDTATPLESGPRDNTKTTEDAEEEDGSLLRIPESKRNVWYIVLSILGLFVLLGHRSCPETYKNLDLFAENHIIENNHAVRRSDSRLGASYTLTLPLIACAIGIQVFGSPNLLTSRGLVPASDVLLDLSHEDLFGYINITFRTYSFSVGDVCSGIRVPTPEEFSEYSDILDCDPSPGNSVASPVELEISDAGAIICEGTLQCKVQPTFRGEPQIKLLFPDSFQNIKWSVSVLNFESLKNTTQWSHVLSPPPPPPPHKRDLEEQLHLTGSIQNPTVIKFGATRALYNNALVRCTETSNDPLCHSIEEFTNVVRNEKGTSKESYSSYGLRLSWRGTKKWLESSGTRNGEHCVSFLFDVGEAFYKVDVTMKLDILTRITNILTLMLSVMSVWRVMKAFSEFGIDHYFLMRSTKRQSLPPADVVQRLACLVEHGRKKELEKVLDHIHREPSNGGDKQWTNVRSNIATSTASQNNMKKFVDVVVPIEKQEENQKDEKLKDEKLKDDENLVSASSSEFGIEMTSINMTIDPVNDNNVKSTKNNMTEEEKESKRVNEEDHKPTAEKIVELENANKLLQAQMEIMAKKMDIMIAKLGVDVEGDVDGTNSVNKGATHTLGGEIQ